MKQKRKKEEGLQLEEEKALGEITEHKNPEQKSELSDQQKTKKSFKSGGKTQYTESGEKKLQTKIGQNGTRDKKEVARDTLDSSAKTPIQFYQFFHCKIQLWQ